MHRLNFWSPNLASPTSQGYNLVAFNSLCLIPMWRVGMASMPAVHSCSEPVTVQYQACSAVYSWCVDNKVSKRSLFLGVRGCDYLRKKKVTGSYKTKLKKTQESR